MRSGSNAPRVGSYNRNVVLDAIRQSAGVSRVELAGRTGLTQQAVSNIVRRLIQDGLVSESGQIQTGLGKPRMSLQVNERANHAVGVHIDPHSITYVVLNLVGDVVARRARRPPAGASPATVIRQVARAVGDLVAGSGVAAGSVLGLGVASPGPIDAERGEVVSPPNLPGWQRVPLRDALAEQTGLPVYLDNDATAAASGERWVGRTERSGSFLFVYLGTGIGSGLVLADQVYRGDTGNAAELGHVPVDAAGRPCHCGGRGCVEAYAGLPAILAGLGTADGPGYRDWADLDAAVAAGSEPVRAAVTEAAGYLGAGTVSAINMVDVNRVIIGGQVRGRCAEIFRAAVERAVSRRAIARSVRPLSVEASLAGQDVGAIGAASLVLHGNYAPHTSALLADITPR
jgi:predicted NBD/HSP70 family sugar kinase